LRTVISLSGGMDSTGLLLHLLNKGCEVDALTFNYGQKHLIEIDRAKANIEYLRSKGHSVTHKIINLSDAMSCFHSALTDTDFEVPEGYYEEENMKDTVVPNRNAIFSSILFGYALSVAKKESVSVMVALGVHSGDHEIYPDCREPFYDKLQLAFREGNWDADKVFFYLPFLKGDKTSILEECESHCQWLKVDFNTIFKNTNTSYNPDSLGRSSGKSGADVERILAFHSIGKADPVTYVKPWEDVLANALEVQSGYGG